MAHPEEVFSRSPEPAVVNPSNRFILDPHLTSAAFEHPLGHDDARYWGDDLDDAVRRLVLDDRLLLRQRFRANRRDVRGVWAGRGFPAHGIGLRSGSAREYRIMLADGTLVGTVDEGRAFEVVHPGAVYLHRGVTYRVVQLDLDDCAAVVVPASGDEYTQPRTDTTIRVLTTDAKRVVGRARPPARCARGDVTGHRLPTQGLIHRRSHGNGDARTASDPAGHARHLVARPSATAARRRNPAGFGSRHPSCRRACGHRDLAAVHDL